MVDLWGTAVPNWIMAAGSGATGIAVVIALLAYRRDLANDRRVATDRERELARKVWASWVTDGTRWGVLVRNSHSHEVYDVVIDCVGNTAGDRIRRRVLGAGEHVFLSNPLGSKRAWAHAQAVEPDDHWGHVHADTHHIASVRFTHEGRGWRALPLEDSGQLSVHDHGALKEEFAGKAR